MAACSMHKKAPHACMVRCWYGGPCMMPAEWVGSNGHSGPLMMPAEWVGTLGSNGLAVAHGHAW